MSITSQSASVAVIAAAELRHRLRTPLNHMIGYSEILLEEYTAPVWVSRLNEVLFEANRMLDAVQQVAGGDQTSVPVTLLGKLRDQLAGGMERLAQTVQELKGLMPAEALADLNRIGAASASLLEALEGQSVELTAAVSPPRASTRAEPFAGPGRILVVDDNELNRDMLSRQLERQNHEVATAPDGETALAMLRKQPFDLMLLDLMMPGMNGFEVLEAVKSDPSMAGVAVILVSALDEMEGVVRSIEAGAEDYLFKPVNPTLLRARIRSTLEKLRAEQTVRRKQRLESIGLLAAGIAHDFNNLLTGIIGHAQLLEQVLASDEDRDMAQSIIKAGERAAELTRQLLAYSGKAMFVMESLDLATVIQESEALIRAALPRKVRLAAQVQSVPAITADPNQIRQALLNLTLNAGEAIGADCIGTVTISTGVERIEKSMPFDVTPDEVKPGRYAWFEVRDSGCGMDTATVGKIFEPFFTTRFLGRGLGLAAVAGIVRAHMGVLRVSSVPGEGTALRLYFPLASDTGGGVESDPGNEPAQVKERLVLVIDDEPIIRQIVKVSLERAGRKVLLASSGEEALAAFREHGAHVELVLLDWKMPVMDGAETLLRLREIRADVRVIVSSGFGQAEAEESFAKLGVAGYLQKPYRMSELVNVVEKAAPRG